MNIAGNQLFATIVFCYTKVRGFLRSCLSKVYRCKAVKKFIR